MQVLKNLKLLLCKGFSLWEKAQVVWKLRNTMCSVTAGERLQGLKSGRQGRVNMITGYRGHQLLAPVTVTGACNRTVFELWLEICLIPVLKPFHHGGHIAELIAAEGAQVAYLPPYSPDLNRIEKCWAWLKSRIRKQRREALTLRDAMEAVLKPAAS
jgi:transposase